MEFTGILFPLKPTRNRIYKAPAAQGLTCTFKKHVLNPKIADVNHSNISVILLTLA